ncbi:Protein translocase subunit SecA [Oxytricha trifallax]|uniref:Protein translocase subunit SecA n=1 Tax=Oxytricha trifallax TaxID=1172189 RepID=A0A073HZ37_9SPIT|nr:Protein translocase subunit SecA [Oxytricha trifallax]
MSNQVLKLQQIIGFDFLSLQKLALNYLLWEDSKFSFINIGVGNGKTLLCSTLAALYAKSSQLPVFIIGKNDHLILRDEKRFEQLVTSLSLNINVNQYEKKAGVYYLTQKYLESQLGNQEFLDIWGRSIVLIDEYDWILFDGSISQMEKNLKFFNCAKRLVGFTGSTLSLKEANCLQIAFKSREIFFPKLSSLVGDKRIRLEQELVSSNQADFCKRIFELSAEYCKLTPVIIVANQSYSTIESYFRKYSQVQFFSMKNVKGTKLEAQFDQIFASKNGEGQYGVFLLNEQQGRGTDLKTNHEIEFNGGLFLIVSDVFSTRSTQQIIGRVGRLHRKGTYRQIIYKQGFKETIEQIISLHQQCLENEIHMKIAMLQTVLG